MNKYIYIDTKIKGAVLQLISYYKSGVFDKNTIILFKVYKENKKYLKILNDNNISYKTIYRYKDIPNLTNSIVFYLFNAQSNCRLVAYREAIHVFVTHGESNKVSSIKPIVRIYDYVTVAGQGGIDRYLENQIFYKDDLYRNRLIRMGTTFIGDPNYQYNKKSKNILYAPTWEGGLVEENYSSIDSDLNAFKLLDDFAKNHQVDTIFIQPHPNLAHRDKRYMLYFIQGLHFLLTRGHKINIVSHRFEHIYKILFMRYKERFSIESNFKSKIDIYRAFVDISAMEIQLMSVDIPTYVFFSNSKGYIPNNPHIKEHYNRCGVFDFKYKNDIYIDREVKNYYISYDKEFLKNYNKNNRLNWLCEFISNSKHEAKF